MSHVIKRSHKPTTNIIPLQLQIDYKEYDTNPTDMKDNTYED